MGIALALARHCGHALCYGNAERQVMEHFCKLEFPARHDELRIALQIITAIYSSPRGSRGRAEDESEHDPDHLNRNPGVVSPMNSTGPPAGL
jgi:hypothetical protein